MAVSVMQGAILQARLAFAILSGLRCCLLRGLGIGFPICIGTILQVGLGSLPLDLFGHCLCKFKAFAELNKFCRSVLAGIKALVDHVCLLGFKSW